ncbi:hypothetical protein P7C70_g7287, partial [Phenoliferia sp. Uapishka_3]
MSPALSHSSLTSLLDAYSPDHHSSLSPRRVINNLESLGRLTAAGARSPFSSSIYDVDTMETADAMDDARENQDREDARQWEEEPSSTSEGDVVSHASDISEDEGTQLAPRRQTRAIPITRGRSHSDTTSADSANNDFSPVQSRAFPLGPSSGSPPSWSRRRRRREHRRSSVSPGPASVEERRRARAALAASAEDGGAKSFLELIDGSKNFMQSNSHTRGRDRGGSSSGTAYNSPNDFRHTYDTTTSLPAPPPSWTPEGPLSPTSSFPSSDPVLASSVPTIDLSSGGEMDDELSPSRRASRKGVSSSKPQDSEGTPVNPGWFSWFGRSIEIKVWHLVGLAGILIGVGVGLSAAYVPTYMLRRFTQNR